MGGENGNVFLWAEYKIKILGIKNVLWNYLFSQEDLTSVIN